MIAIRAKFSRINKKLNGMMPLVATALAFAIIGSILSFDSHAATPVTAVEAESGTPSSAASSVTDGTASGSKAIKFGSGGSTIPPVPSGTQKSIMSLGAKCDGVTNDQTAIQNALSNSASGTVLMFPSGATCVHSSVLRVYSAGIALYGVGTTLLATDQTNSSLEVQANNVTVDGFDLKTQNATARRDPFESEGMTLLDSSGAVVNDITIDKPAAGGFMASGASNYTVSGLTVNNSLADCIHNTDGSNNGTYTNLHVTNCGDDGFAVVSYLNDGTMAHDISVNGFTMYSQSDSGRGITVVGGYNVTYTNINVTDSCGAGLYIASEPSYQTYGVSNVTVSNVTMNAVNHCGDVLHGAVLVYNGQPSQTISHIDLENFNITNTDNPAEPSETGQVGIRQGGSGGVSGIQYRNFTINGGNSDYFYTDSGSSTYNLISFTGEANHQGFTPY
jgi:hypothetical protein